MDPLDTKLIKSSGNGGLTRTSQACDRCRIKKIKCDGKIPSCTNCLNIGYNCQTSDKLTRRAFPRGYTENLEKNLIFLQNENARLITEMDLLKKHTKGSNPLSNGSDQALPVPPKDSSASPKLSPATPPNVSFDRNMVNESSFEIKKESVSFSSPSSFARRESHSHTHSHESPHSSHENATQEFEGLSENFFRYNNFTDKENYVGLNCLNVLFDNVVASMGLSPVEELHYPAIDTSSIYDFVIAKFLSKFPSKTNLDLLISNHFEHLNLIPILDEGTFFKFYKEMFSFIDNKTDNLAQLLTQAEPTNVSNEDRLVFIATLVLIIQLNCSIFSIHEIHKFITSLNLSVNITIPKFQALLLALYLFHNKNCYKNTVINLTNIAHACVLSLGLHLNYNNLQQIGSQSTTKEMKFRYYAVRLKLYWSFYILSTISGIFFGLPQIGFFDRFHVPQLVTILNANQNLKHTLSLIELLGKFENINLLSIGEDPQKLKDIDQVLVNWRKDLGLNTFFSKLSKESSERRHKKAKKSGTFFSRDDIIKIQLNMFYLTLRTSIHLRTSFDKKSLISSQSTYVISSLSREYLAYIILLDRKRELNNLNNFEFHLVPINFLKFCLISMLSIVNLSQEFSKEAASLLNDAANLITQTLKVIKNRYPENFILFKELVIYIKRTFSITDSTLDYETLETPSHSSDTADLLQSDYANTLFRETDRHSSMDSNVSSVSSIFSNNYTTNFNSNNSDPLKSDTLNTDYHSSAESYTMAESDMSMEDVPDLTNHFGLMFDWNTHGIKGNDSSLSSLKIERGIGSGIFDIGIVGADK